jgi:uncharacterized protein YbjT (DUF2867 family)
MEIAVVGGTGTLGRLVVAALAERGHSPRALSRKPPATLLPTAATHARVDLTTGDGLDEALDAVDVVVDASNGPPSARAAAILVDGTKHLLDAEQRAGVGHHVCASIVGIEHVPVGYYKVKVRQEELVVGGPIAWTIVRATQFHELTATWFARLARMRVLPAPRFPLQPIDAATAAVLVADVAEAEPRRDHVQIAGPRIEAVPDLAAEWRERTGTRTAIVRVPLLGKAGRALRDGALTSPADAAPGGLTFTDWLSGPGARG